MAATNLSDWESTRPHTHALPMRMLLHELRCIRGEEKFLEALAASLFVSGDPNRPAAPFNEGTTTSLLNLLEENLLYQEDAYTQLDREKNRIRSEQRIETVGDPVMLTALEELCFEADKPLKRVLHYLRGNALAFSGGGIRSASFCLGILQGLARFTLVGGDEKQDPDAPNAARLLNDTQYLSTVSGGGYLGCWFSSWVARLAARGAMPGVRPSAARFEEAYNTTLRGLAGRLPETSGDPSPETVRHLREFTAYLAPQLGLSLDVWALFAIISRNLLINFLMLAPMLFFIVNLPALIIFWLGDLHQITNTQNSVFLLFIFALVMFSAIISGRALPSYRPWVGAPAKPGSQSANATSVFLRFVLPVLAVCFLLSAHFYPGTVPPVPSALDAAGLTFVATVGFGILGIFKWWTHYATFPGNEIRDTAPMRASSAAALIFAVTIFLGAGTGVGLELIGTRIMPAIARLHFQSIQCEVEPANYIIFCVPAFLTVLMLGSTLFSALTQLLESEEDREWWSRAGGFLISWGFVWLISTALSLYGTAWHHGARFMPSLSGGALGLITSFIAKSSLTKAGTRPDNTPSKKSPLSSLLLPALAIASLALLAVGLARLSEAIRNQWHADSFISHPAIAVLALLAIFATLATVVNLLVNVNIFSLHGMYRERLMRAFLGASNSARHTDAFTDFDSGDTLLMSDLARTPGVPLHIVNTTLNLVGTRRAAWRQRKAEAFSFSAISAGAWRLNYVAAEKFGGDHGVSVATAMAISGAAANPNMGYHSSPLVTILMTLFNVRLGWWLPNPRYPLDHRYGRKRQERFWKRSGPIFSVWPLLQELFGLTDDSRGYVELSDGGHFEDLGLYEMVLRRCGNIIVVDSGADPTFTFEDLGNALRKIEIDLGIPIRFVEKPSMHAGEKSIASKNNRYCAVADIRYSCVDDSMYQQTSFDGAVSAYDKPPGSTTRDGKLIYIKSCLNGVDEPMDVIEYSRTHAAFPHEGTGNQFFNEAQFESYRSLGSHVVARIGEGSAGTDWLHWVAAATHHAASRVE